MWQSQGFWLSLPQVLLNRHNDISGALPIFPVFFHVCLEDEKSEPVKVKVIFFVFQLIQVELCLPEKRQQRVHDPKHFFSEVFLKKK